VEKDLGGKFFFFYLWEYGKSSQGPSSWIKEVYLSIIHAFCGKTDNIISNLDGHFGFAPKFKPYITLLLKKKKKKEKRKTPAWAFWA